MEKPLRQVRREYPQKETLALLWDSKRWQDYDDITIVSLLKDCAQQKDLYKGIQIHDEIVKKDLPRNNIFIANTLINMYAKCGALTKAQEVFNELPVHDVVSWNALVTGYAQHGCGEEALHCYEKMQGDHLSPDAVTFTSVLKACGSIGAIETGIEIHQKIASNAILAKDVVLGNALVDMYAKCGDLRKAEQVFDELVIQNTISWNTLMSGYCQHGQCDLALDCFELMIREKVSQDVVTFILGLKACGSTRAAKKGEAIHHEIIRKGLLGTNAPLQSALIDMYAKCDALAKAQQVLDGLPLQNVVSWTALILGYCEHEQGEKAINCFKRIREKGLFPDAVTFSCTLKACGSVRGAEKGREIHVEIARTGMLGNNIVMENAVMDMYAKCGELARSQEVFDGLPVRNVVTWNTLLAGYAQHEHAEKVLALFRRMGCEGLLADELTLSCILKACGTMASAEKGKEVHAGIVAESLLGENTVLGNALIDMYAKCGALSEAQQVLNELPLQNVVSWNALLAGYCEFEHGDEALDCFKQMKQRGFFPDVVTFACILKTCGSIGAAEKGKEIHREIVQKGWLGNDTILGNAVVDMYAKCGVLVKAHQVFDGLLVKDVVSWNALVTGYCENGFGQEALECLEQMIDEGLFPDAITFGCILRACSSTGAAEKGEKYFETFGRRYGIIVDLDHYSCMVDVFARAGHFEKAMAAVKKMPCSDYLPVWFALLNASHKWGNVDVGRLAFEHAVQLDDKSALPYVCMSSIYAAAGMQEDANIIDAMQMEKEASVG